MSGNLWLKLSVDGGKTFADLDFTKIFADDTTFGGWAGDQAIHYVPSLIASCSTFSPKRALIPM